MTDWLPTWAYSQKGLRGVFASYLYLEFIWFFFALERFFTSRVRIKVCTYFIKSKFISQKCFCSYITPMILSKQKQCPGQISTYICIVEWATFMEFLEQAPDQSEVFFHWFEWLIRKFDILRNCWEMSWKICKQRQK